MIQTKLTRTLAPVGSVPAGELSHALLPVLALCLATAAWSQSTFGQKGPHRPSIMSGVAPSARPAADTPAGAQYKFITIGVPGSANAQAQNINDAGLVTGFYLDASSNSHGFVWRNGAFQTVDYRGAVYTYLTGTNNQGLAVGYYGAGDSTEHSVTYAVQSGTWTALPDIPGYSENEAYGINDADFVVGNAYEGSTTVAWIWDPATSAYSFYSEPAAESNGTYSSDINDKGQIVGFYVDSSGVTHGFLKQGATYTTFDAPGASATSPQAINNSGTIGGQWNDAAGAAQGFVLTGGGLFTAVDYPGPELTAIIGINERGDICGTYVENPSGARKAYVGFRR